MTVISIYPKAVPDPSMRMRWQEADAIPEGYTTIEPPAANEGHTVEWDGDNWAQVPVPPDPDPEPYIPATPALIATAMIGMTEGVISSVSVSAALAGIMQFGVGEYWAFFTESQPDTDYMVLAYNGGTHLTGVATIDKAGTHFVIRATDFAGNPDDPDCVNVEVKRVI